MTFNLATSTRLALGALWTACVLIGCSEKPEALLDSARLYLERNDNKAAIIQLKNALQANPNLSEARFLLGSALLETGDPVGAEAELRKSMELKHPMDVVVPQLANALLAQGQVKKVTDEFADTHLGLPSAQASLQNSIATAFAMQGQTERSEAALDAALQADPGFGPALLERARQSARQRDFEGAQSLVDSVIAKDPKSHEAWKLKGDVYWIAQGKATEAMEAYTKAIAIKSDFFAGQTALMMVLLQQGNLEAAAIQLEQLKKLAANHPQTQYLAALLAYQKKDIKAASEQVQAALKVVPNHIAGLQLAGAVELQLNHLQQAQTYLNKALEIQPTLQMARRLLVVTYLRSGQAAKAMETLLPGLNQSDTDPALTSLAGDVFLQNGNLAKAQEYFTKASAQDPKNSKKRTSLALVHLISGSTENAFGELREISVSDTGATADLALISALIRRKEFDKALAAIDVLERKQPNKALPPYLRAQVLLNTGDAKSARTQMERAAVLEPTFFPAAAGLATLDLAEKSPADARKRFEALLLRDPKNGQALLALADLAAKTGAPTEDVAKLIGNAVAANPLDVNTRLMLINFHLQNKDIKGASSAAQNAAAAMPNDSRILDALGSTQQASGDLNQSLATYRKMVDVLPQSPLPYWRMAVTQMAMNDKEAAVNSLRKTLTMQSDFLEGQRALVALYVYDKKYPDALNIALSVQKQRPKEDVGFVLEGDIHGSNNQWDTASRAFRSGLAQVKTTTLAMKLHTALQAAGKGTEADQFSVVWQREHPKDAAFEFYLGDQALAHKDYNKSEKHFSMVVKLQPNNAIALNNLAWVSAKLNKEGAIAYAEKAIALAPNQPMFMDTLATLCSEKGDYARALDLQTRALTLQPQSALLKLNLAKIHLRAGKKELAKSSLDVLAGLGSTFPGQAEVAALQKELAALPETLPAR
jgi:putative PEP-CTERM system TPR-repeat lipoprotein